MSRRACCLAVAVMAAAAVLAARDSATPAVALPALARVTADEPSGETWRQVGELGGSVATARGECAAALAAAGWRLDKTIVLGRSPARSELMLWIRGTRRVLFMVWEKEAGTCGFAWGEER
ncbi:MAG TPA: hypothetical protein PLU38_01550 [Kiritimatiellia bacterium]|nr:MAG: hypothetical protein BWX70_00723 [Verrucomicrobia bacterium ADurb.Bin070]HPO36379.1 hypothetical protein [Kiritimatiellia bacterium]HQA38274.1 hypothetical protein [Kiritimatiellia bacterium]HQL50062.1 hypothetical protein [Kiritimatiellia bacterium]HQQ90524.1 hypothetical protein [Kiritimatiellia bacterium]